MKRTVTRYAYNKLAQSFNEKIEHKTGELKYILAMFPYPSGVLHVGHLRNYALTDFFTRYYHLKGYKVLHPMGFDAFGLPAENAAIERKISPKEWTLNNIETMKKTMKNLNFLFDWDRLMATCDESYVGLQQKLFIEMWQKGIIIQKEDFVNWDPKENTVLANEQIDENGFGWRSGVKIEKRRIKQWFIKIKEFAEDLLNDLNGLDWPESIKKMQENWIGKQVGFNVDFHTKNGEIITLFVEKLDLLSRTVMIFVPLEISYALNAKQTIHNLNSKEKKEIETLLFQNREIKIFMDEKISSNIFITKEEDLRFISIENQNIDVCEIAKPHNNDFLDLNMLSHIEYKMKDWCISRQRYWGCPIPLIYCKSCGVVPAETPVILPENVSFQGKSLESNSDWLNVSCPQCGDLAKRETDTLDTFFDSSWYFLRFCSFDNMEEAWDKRVCPVDLYIGGAEHAVMHLLYARFFVKFFHNKIGFKEPFKKLINQGMVCMKSYFCKKNKQYYYPDEVIEKDGMFFVKVEGVLEQVIVGPVEKMSKSKKNCIQLDKSLETYGSDTLRFAILSDSPPEKTMEWNENAVRGCFKFISKIWDFVETIDTSIGDFEGDSMNEDNYLSSQSKNFIYLLENSVKLFAMNLYITNLRMFFDLLENQIIYLPQEQIQFKCGKSILKKYLIDFLICLWPVCPLLASNCLEKFNINLSLVDFPFGEAAASFTKIGIQINGKTRGELLVTDKNNVEKDAAKIVGLDQYIKVIYVEGKIINFII